MTTVNFTPKQFEVLRKFQNHMNSVFGDSAYVGTDNAVVLLEYSPQLKAMLRPYPSENFYDFEVNLLTCEDCKKTALFLSLPGEENYVCNDCVGRRKKKE